MALTAQIALSILAHETSSGDISRTLRATPVSYAASLSDGTGANQAQVVWSASRTATSAGETLDLRSLADTREDSAAVVSFTAIKTLFIRNTGVAPLRIGGLSAINSPWAGLPNAGTLSCSTPYQLAPGACLCLCDPSDSGLGGGVQPIAGVSYFARFSTSSSSTTYDIVLIGEGTIT